MDKVIVMKTIRKAFTENQLGAAAVEFALLLPILLVITFGIIEFSILFYDKAMITNASREGARAGIVYREDRYDETVTEAYLKDKIVDAINAYLSEGNNDFKYLINLGGTSSPPTIAIDGVKGGSGDPLKVSISYNYEFLVFSNLIELLNAVSGSEFPASIDLFAQTIMRLE